jgi:hypothetical protein
MKAKISLIGMAVFLYALLSLIFITSMHGQDRGLSDEQILGLMFGKQAENTAAEMDRNIQQGTIMSDLVKIAAYGSPENAEDATDLIGLIKTDSTLVYEGATYSTTITYEVKYKVGTRIVEDYTPLADTALIHYTVHSTYNNIQYHGSRDAESVDFRVSGIKMPTTEFEIDLLSNFDMIIEYELEPHFVFHTVGETFINDMILNIYTNEIESGSGGMRFNFSINGNAYPEEILAEIEFLGDNVVQVTINGRTFTFTFDIGSLIP